jgi:hypothetical protein
MPCTFLARVYASEHLLLLTFFYNIPPLDNKKKEKEKCERSFFDAPHVIEKKPKKKEI